MIFGYQPSKKDIKNAKSVYDIDQMKINLHEKRKLLEIMKSDRKNNTHKGSTILLKDNAVFASKVLGIELGVTGVASGIVGTCAGIGATGFGVGAAIGACVGALLAAGYVRYQEEADNSSTNQKYKKELPKLISALEKNIKDDEAILKMLTVK